MDVFGVGNALVDIQARVDDEVVSQLGFDKGIMTLVEDDVQRSVLDRLDSNDWSRCAGGSAANTIAAIAQLGGSAAYACKVGDDEIGQFYVSDLEGLGVQVHSQPISQPTGTCAVLITPDAQRTMLTNLSASTALSESDIDEAAIAAAKYVYIEGYLLTGDNTKAAAYRAMDLAKKNNTKVAFTASDPFLVNMIRDEIWDLITGPVDLFFCNEEEATSLTGKEDPIAAAADIHAHAEHVALTLGGKGSILMNDRSSQPIEGVSVNAIDTTGAGDMYAGAFLYGVTQGHSLAGAGHLASHAAARVVSQMGARLAKPFTENEVKDLVG